MPKLLNIFIIVFTTFQEVVKRSYIRLADKHEAELQLAAYKPKDREPDWENLKINFTEALIRNSTMKNTVKPHENNKTVGFTPDSEEHFYGGYKDEQKVYDVSDDDTNDRNDENRNDYDDINYIITRNYENDENGDEYDEETQDIQREEKINKYLKRYHDINLEDDDDDTDSELEENDDDIDQTAERVLARRTRAAQEQWKNSDYGTGASKTKKSSKSGNTEPDDWELITDEELAYGKNVYYKQTAEFLGITLLSVAGFAFIGICFIRDPVACVFAFGTGCPCCIIFCPCIRAFTDKYLDSKRMIRESMNTYMPGVIVNEDGSMDFYEPTPEEVEILHEILEELTGL